MVHIKRKFSTKVAVIFPDMHIASASSDGVLPIDRHDPAAISIALQITRDLHPDIAGQLGDLNHFGYLSGFARRKDQLGRSPAENGETIDQTLERDLDLDNIFWDLFQKNARASEYFQEEGNHDEIIRDARQMNSYRPYVTKNWWLEAALHLKERGIQWIPYQVYDGKPNWYQLGKLKVLHGNYTSPSFLKRTHEAYGGNIVMGHMHSINSATFQTVEHVNGAWSLGCLCSKTCSYSRGRTNSWQQGFGVIYLHSDGRFNLYIPYIVKGICHFNGKLYTAKRLPGLE